MVLQPHRYMDGSTHKVRVMLGGCSGGCMLTSEYSEIRRSKKFALPCKEIWYTKSKVFVVFGVAECKKQAIGNKTRYIDT
jgi:hypothetical protein